MIQAEDRLGEEKLCEKSTRGGVGGQQAVYELTEQPGNIVQHHSQSHEQEWSQ